jgi:hypothetical protein
MPTQYPLIYTGTLFEVVDAWSKSIGKHVLKWGGEVHRNRCDRFRPQSLNHVLAGCSIAIRARRNWDARAWDRDGFCYLEQAAG